MKVLLTGHKGFIGQNLHAKIKDLGWDCYTFDYDFFDATVENRLTEVMRTKFDIIFHVGANSNTMDHDYNTMMRTNYLFSKCLFDLAGDTRIVYSSSAAVYGDDSGIPTNIYAWSKKSAEDYGLAKCKNFVALRYFNVYGPHEEHKGRMSSVAYQSWKSQAVSLFPKRPMRDFVYVDDVVEANIYAGTGAVKTGWYDVGTGKPRSFEDLVGLMKVTRITLTDEHEIPKGYQVYTKARKLMHGWTAKNSLEQGCAKYLKYLGARSLDNITL
tara:strand:+ start:150 stop:959 length:810 start_codon:yes stop_codon:yes gene_type:complete